MRVLAFWIAVVALCCAAILLHPARAQVAPDPSQFPNCEGFIASHCCCTNGACFVISRADIVRIDETHYRILRTGEIVEAKGKSPDGRVRRCTYDYDPQRGFVRIGHPDAKTSCLYVTETGS